jgi:selenocysteine lyase/cysteine desulfurase
MPINQWQEQLFARISVQGYTTQDDIDKLLRSLGTLLSEYAK